MPDGLRLRLSFGSSDPALVYRSLCGAIDALIANADVPVDTLERMSHGLAELVDAIFLDARVTSAEITAAESGLVTALSYAGSSVDLDVAAAQIVEGAFDEVRQEVGLIRVRVRP
jgi:hypothetical protein